MEDKSKIGAFFKEQLSDYQEGVSLMELEMMSTRMSSHNFMKFSVFNFNVYYAAAIFSGFLISLVLGGHYLITYRQQEILLRNTRKELASIQKQVFDTNNTQKGGTAYPKSANDYVIVPESPSGPTTSNLNKGKNSLSQPTETLLSPTKESATAASVPNSSDAKTNQNNYEGKAGSTVGATAPTVPLPEPQKSTQSMPVTIEKEALNALKKKIIIYKRDTIYEYDTLKVKKKSR